MLSWLRRILGVAAAAAENRMPVVAQSDHSRCKDIEAVLRSQIDDLQAALGAAHDRIDELLSETAVERRQLIDRILIGLPGQARAAVALNEAENPRPVVAASPMPVVAGSTRPVSGFAGGGRQMPPNARPVAGPRRVPTTMGITRPSVTAAEAAAAAALDDGQIGLDDADLVDGPGE